MEIMPLSPVFCARPALMSVKDSSAKLKRLCEYQGPVLKLTPKDKDKIAMLKKEIAGIETDMYKLSRYLDGCKDIRSRMYYNDQMLHFESQIEILQNQIKNIKTERFLKQKNLFNKRHVL